MTTKKFPPPPQEIQDILLSPEEIRALPSDPSKISWRKLTPEEITKLNEYAEQCRRADPDAEVFDFGAEMDKREEEALKRYNETQGKG